MKIKRNGIKVKVSKKAILALVISALAGSAPQLANGIPAIGEYWPGQGGVNHGYLKGRDGSPGFWVVAAVDADVEGNWGSNKEIAGEFSDWDGAHNTDLMVAGGSDLAKKVRAYSADGHTDFYIGAPSEMHLCYANRDEHWKKDKRYWTSKQYSSLNAWCQWFDGGYATIYNEGLSVSARPLRRVIQ